MKKLLSTILTVILVLSILGVYNGTQTIFVSAAKNSENSDWPASPDVFAQTGVLIEASTGTVLLL